MVALGRRTNTMIAVAVLMVAMLTTGCDWPGSESGPSPVPTLDAEDCIPPTIPTQPPPDTSDPIPTPNATYAPGYDYNISWLISDVYVDYGGAIMVWVNNIGPNALFIRGYVFNPSWAPDAAFSRTSNRLIANGTQGALGRIGFSGPRLDGNYTYKIRLQLCAQLPNGSWYDYDLTGQSSYEVTAKPLAEPGEYEVIANERGYSEVLNDNIYFSRDRSEEEVRTITAPYGDGYSVYHLCAIFEYLYANISYLPDPLGEANYWAPPAETIAIRKGDCEDHAMLLAGLVGALGGTSRAFLKDGHAFMAVFVGNESHCAAVLDAVDRYYGTELTYAVHRDAFGCWLVCDDLGGFYTGCLPQSGAPVERPEQPGNEFTWDFPGDGDLHIVDIVRA